MDNISDKPKKNANAIRAVSSELRRILDGSTKWWRYSLYEIKYAIAAATQPKIIPKKTTINASDRNFTPFANSNRAYARSLEPQ